MDFEQTYNLYFERIYLYLRARLASAQVAEDLAAEVFIAAWQVWGQFQSEAHARNWLFRVAYNKLANQIRREYKFDFASLEEFDESFFGPYTDSSEVGAASGASREWQSLCWKLVAELPEREQNLISLRYKESKTFSEIAVLLEVTLNNAKVLHNRILKKLISRWEKINSQTKKSI